VLRSDLHPTSGSRAKIDAYPRIIEELVFLVELNELEGGTRAVALLLRQAIIRDEELRRKREMNSNHNYTSAQQLTTNKHTNDVQLVTDRKSKRIFIGNTLLCDLLVFTHCDSIRERSTNKQTTSNATTVAIY